MSTLHADEDACGNDNLYVRAANLSNGFGRLVAV